MSLEEYIHNNIDRDIYRYTRTSRISMFRHVVIDRDRENTRENNMKKKKNNNKNNKKNKTNRILQKDNLSR
jgi:hypothetical protein